MGFSLFVLQRLVGIVEDQMRQICVEDYFGAIKQQYSTGVLKEFLKHSIPDYFVRSLTSVPLDYQIK